MTGFEIFLGFVFCVLSAFIGYSLQVFDFEFFLFSKKLRYKGFSYDINRITGKVKLSDSKRLKDFQFGDDFNREKFVSYEYNNIIIKIRGDGIKMTGKMQIENFRENPINVSLNGKGKYFSKRKDGSGFAYMLVSNKSKSLNLDWDTLYIFRINLTKEIEGYWITENKDNIGAFVFGFFKFNPDSED